MSTDLKAASLQRIGVMIANVGSKLPPSQAELMAELRRRGERERKLVEAARSLADSLDDAMPHINNACIISGLHGIPYRGPQFNVEALRSALSEFPQESSP